MAGLGRTFKFEAESIEEGMSWISALEEVNKRGPLLQPTVSVFDEAQRHRSMFRIVSGGGGKAEVQAPASQPNGGTSLANWICFPCKDIDMCAHVT